MSPTLRRLTWLSAALYAATGVILFVAPGWAAQNFAWSVSPFVAMTIGGWCLGNAAFAALAARDGRLSIVLPHLAYLLAFAVGEGLVLVAFRDRFIAAVLAPLYVATLGLGLVAGAVGVSEAARARIVPEGGRRPGPLTRAGILFFIGFVGVLAVGGTLARQGGLSTEGGIFPEALTLFTVRAFAAFYGALGVGAAALLIGRGMEPVRAFGRAGLILIVPIVAAALINIGAFDFANRPGGILYFGAYLVTLAGTAFVVARGDPVVVTGADPEGASA
jgi:hypothetical protein